MPRADASFGPDRAAGDVTEAIAWCPDCQEERNFLLRELDVAEYDPADLNPVLQDVVNGEPVYHCGVCGRLEPDLINARAYRYELRDTGYEVGQWQDEELPDDDGAALKPDEWVEEDAREPRGRGIHPDRILPKADGLTAGRKSPEPFE